ncbi:MAG: amidohydrolase family protein [Chloroflexota bacterium]
MPKTAFTNCFVVDGLNSKPLPAATVLVEDGRIAWLHSGDGAVVPEDAAVVDLKGHYLLPGLWDCHCHPGGMIPDPERYSSFETESELTLRALRNITAAFRAGVTGLRVVAEAAFVDVALREAFAGVAPAGMWHDVYAEAPLHGPRMFVAGPGLRITGGHGAERRVKGLVNWDIEVDGADEVRKATRYVIKMGVDWVKLMITGGIAGVREGMGESQMTFDEIKAACDAAHNKGLKVCAHIGAAAAAKLAVEAGLDSVEHGYLLDREVVDRMAERGVWYVPTLTVTEDEQRLRLNRTPDYSIERALAGAEAHRRSFELALRAGVKIASGADMNPMWVTSVKEIYWLGRCGMTNLQALQAATIRAAELCGVADDLGTVEAGKLADLIVVPDDPLADLTHLCSVEMVIKEGQIVVDRPSEAG